MVTIMYTTYQWKFGELFIAMTPRGICRIEFSKQQNEESFVDSLKTLSQDHVHREDNQFRNLCSQLNSYFLGEKVIFDEPIDFLTGTIFQKKVWQKVSQIPYGQVITYGAIAKQIGNPKAVRAVGRANGANPIPILIPCHRVVAAGGKLGGYGGGLEIKEYLLRLEGAWG
jgi:methylated-DNA-[protein]-cysteine S-methyltransferase